MGAARIIVAGSFAAVRTRPGQLTRALSTRRSARRIGVARQLIYRRICLPRIVGYALCRGQSVNALARAQAVRSSRLVRRGHTHYYSARVVCLLPSPNCAARSAVATELRRRRARARRVHNAHKDVSEWTWRTPVESLGTARIYFESELLIGAHVLVQT